MNARPLVVITTRLSPQVCGIGAYSWLLDRHWPSGHSQTQFLVVDGAAESSATLAYSTISQFDGNAEKLVRELDRLGSANVLLHYAGRAYQRYGCPLWLPVALRKWKSKFPTGRLLIFFHELPGDFPVTSRYFWIDMCNRRVIRKLTELADVIVTNTNEHVRKLHKISGRTDAHLIPVGSNIELASEIPERRAQTEFAIFGLPFGRWQTLQMFNDDVRSWEKGRVLTKLHLIGPCDHKFDARSEQLIAGWPKPEIVVRHGLLPSSEVSQFLACVQFGLTNATVENWSKSTAFMAYAAHGCAIISKATSATPPLRFTVAPDEVATISDVDLIERTRALKEWYDENADWNVTAGKISALLYGNVAQEALK